MGASIVPPIKKVTKNNNYHFKQNVLTNECIGFYLWMIINVHNFLVYSLQITYKMNIETSLEKLA